MRYYWSGLHRHMLRNTLNLCENRPDRNKFKGNELVAFLRRSVRKWDRQCIYFGFLILKSSSNSSVLLYYYPSTFPYSRRHSWGIFPTVGWASFFPLSIEVHVPCCQPWCHKCWSLAIMIFWGCDLIIVLRQIGAACGMFQGSLATKPYVIETYFPNDCGMCVWAIRRSQSI